jgi:2-phosphoglycerate kinase
LTARGDHRPVDWVVTVVCGASGVGKTGVARPLAARYGVPLAEADDIVTALHALHPPEPFVFESVERTVARHLAMAASLEPAFHAVVADHIEFGTPVLFEGDYLSPHLAAGFGPAVRAVVVAEGSRRQLVANFGDREGGEQSVRAEVSARLDAELIRLARAYGVPVVPARPYADGVDRVDAALRRHRTERSGI